MATNFFEHQDNARRNTKWLVTMFVLAVIGVVGTTVLVAAVAVGALEGGLAPQRNGHGLWEENPLTDFDQRWRAPHETRAPTALEWQVPFLAGAAALGLIGGGSLYKIAQLSGGGTVVAERLGGQRIFPNTTSPVERRLLNVVEEMALASGVPVPPVYLLAAEEGINAFAAGFSPSDAVIGVTRGCVEQLTRDQLQGVIAHEFSHILNGDMRLNLRLIGVLHGILLMGLAGREVMRIAARSGGDGRSRRGHGGLVMVLIGLAFMVIGFVGVFFGNLIKAAVSRQREFLADASAVQFTRNPDGLAGALKRIGAAVFGSQIASPRAEEASHMYFATGVNSLFATHPPLEERIRRLDPQWDGSFPSIPRRETVTRLDQEQPASALVGEPVSAAVRAAAVADDESLRRVPSQVIRHAAEQVGNPSEVHQQYVRQVLAEVPQLLLDAAHDPYSARALVFALLLDRDAQVRATQLRALQQSAEANVFEMTLSLTKPVSQLDVRARLPLVDLALPALRAMSLTQYQRFARAFQALVAADEKIALFEWTLYQILLRHLRSQFEPLPPTPIRYYGLQQLGRQCSELLSALARASEYDDQLAFQAGAQRLPEVPLRLYPREASSLSELDDALRELAHVAPKHRQRLVDACAAAICADSSVDVAEAELLRAICDMLDCPMPPLLPGQNVAPQESSAPAPGRAG
jgi:Zn-dependent protease with chaperone function